MKPQKSSFFSGLATKALPPFRAEWPHFFLIFFYFWLNQYVLTIVTNNLDPDPVFLTGQTEPDPDPDTKTPINCSYRDFVIRLSLTLKTHFCIFVSFLLYVQEVSVHFTQKIHYENWTRLLGHTVLQCCETGSFSDFSERNFKFATAPDLTKCQIQIKLPISELPSNINTIIQ